MHAKKKQKSTLSQPSSRTPIPYLHQKHSLLKNHQPRDQSSPLTPHIQNKKVNSFKKVEDGNHQLQPSNVTASHLHTNYQYSHLKYDFFFYFQFEYKYIVKFMLLRVKNIKEKHQRKKKGVFESSQLFVSFLLLK